MSPERRYELQEEMVRKGKSKLVSESKSTLMVYKNQNVCFVELKDRTKILEVRKLSRIKAF